MNSEFETKLNFLKVSMTPFWDANWKWAKNCLTGGNGLWWSRVPKTNGSHIVPNGRFLQKVFQTNSKLNTNKNRWMNRKSNYNNWHLGVEIITANYGTPATTSYFVCVLGRNRSVERCYEDLASRYWQKMERTASTFSVRNFFSSVVTVFSCMLLW